VIAGVRASRLAAPLACALVLLAPNEAASAQAASSSSRLAWREEWSRFHPFEYGFTAALAGINVWMQFGITTPAEPAWKGGVLFDDAARDLRLKDPRARQVVSDLSDVGTYGTQATVVLVDSLLVPALAGSWETALQMELMNAEAFGLTGFVARGLLQILPRERPIVADCREDPTSSPRCRFGPNASFPSGHTAFAFTAAGLACSHQLHAEVYGSRGAAIAACAVQTTFATATGVFRILDDRHWATDVILGAILGAAIGWTVPTLHYRGVIPSPSAKARGAQVSFLPMASTSTWGATAFARF
jgi:membrane-associated phospholipid phosphatase